VRILISGVCGFAGNAIARALAERRPKARIVGFDNFIRPGSEGNRAGLKRLGVRVIHADQRAASDMDALPACDWVIDAAANPSVLAGVDGLSSSRQLMEHNLGGTVNLLEYCKRNRAGLVLLSSSRVYSIEPLADLPVRVKDGAFRPDARGLPRGASPRGISEDFPTAAPVSLYGATKLASEALALEYGQAFDLPVFVNRCGILAGAGQFGRPDQGIFAYWINSHLRRRPLRYIGFGGRGHQVRDCLHPNDLAPLLLAQMDAPQDVRFRQHLERGRRGRLGRLAPAAHEVVRRAVWGPQGRFRAGGARIRHPVDRARCLQGGEDLGLAAEDARAGNS
jgi:CDP-paratose 2-epimerase